MQRPRASEGWSGKRDSNPRLRPWQGRTLPLSYSRPPVEVVIVPQPCTADNHHVLDWPLSVWYDAVFHASGSFPRSAPSPSGKAEVCKTSIPGSNPGGASILRSRIPAKDVHRSSPQMCASKGGPHASASSFGWQANSNQHVSCHLPNRPEGPLFDLVTVGNNWCSTARSSAD